MAETETSESLKLIDEDLSVTTREVETGRVRIRTLVDERTERAVASLRREDVEVERVRIDREIESVPAIREEGDTLVIPVVEEVMVVERRLVLREEVRVTRLLSTERVEEPVTLRSMRAVVERCDKPGSKEKEE